MRKQKIVIADDHQLVREGLRKLLMSMDSNIEVVGEAGDGLEAKEMANKLKPDILILDISMPKMRGIEAIKEIKRTSPETSILILSMHNKEEYIKQTLKNGASGYLLKESAAEELYSAVKFISEGKVYLSPSISKSVVSDWLTEAERTQHELSNNKLTDREQEVLKLLAEGYTNKQIANLLHISNKTVETHRYRIMEKLELKNIAELVRYALRNNIIELH